MFNLDKINNYFMQIFFYKKGEIAFSEKLIDFNAKHFLGKN